MRFNQQVKQNPSSCPLDIPLIPTGFCRDPRLSKRSVRPSQQLALVNFRPPSAIRSPTENHVLLEASGHENMPDAFPEIPKSTERFNGLRLSERFAKVHQDVVVRSPLTEIIAPKEDVTKLRFPLHPVQKITNLPCHQQSMVPREAAVAPGRSVRQMHLYANGSVATTDQNTRRFVTTARSDDDGALGYVSDDLNSDSEDESAAMTQNRPTLNGNVVVNGSTTGNSVVNGITMGYSVVNGSTMDNLVVNGSTTGNLVVNGVTTFGASNIQRAGSPQLSDSSSESEYSDSDDETEGPAAAVEPCIDADRGEEESKKERRWAMENFIPKRTSLVGLTPSDDQATADIIPSTGGNSRDCFDTVSLFDGLAVKPFLDNDLNLTNPIAAPCHAVSQQTAAGENYRQETKLLPPPQPSTSKTSHKRTRDSSGDNHCSKKSKMEAVKTAKSSSTKRVENGSARTEGKGKSLTVSSLQPSTTTASKMSRKMSVNSLKNGTQMEETKVDKCWSLSSTPKENGLSQSAMNKNGLVQHENGTTQRENGTAKHENGIARRESGTALHENGITRHENGTPRLENGTMRHDNRTTRLENGTKQLKNETTCHENGTTCHELPSSSLPPSDLSTTSKASHKRSKERSSEKQCSKKRKSENAKKDSDLSSSSSSLLFNGSSKTHGKEASQSHVGLEPPSSVSAEPQNHVLGSQVRSSQPKSDSKKHQRDSMRTEMRLLRTENGLKQTENGLKQTENGSKHSENRLKQTEKGPIRKENGSKQTENGSKDTENGQARTENRSKSTETGPVATEIESMRTGNGLTLLPQSALTLCPNGPCPVAPGDQPLDRRRANCERNQSERLLPALNYNNERQRLEMQSLTMNPESLSKFMMLTEALNSYVCYAFAYEQQINKINSGKEFEKALAFSRKVCDQETIQQIQHPWKNHVLIICHRLQAVIHFKCYRKNEAGKLKLLLEEQLTKMQPPKRMVCDTGNRNPGPVDTMSLIMQQPTPSPAGSVTSVGSSGSSGERAATMSPNVIISSRTHSIMKSYMNYMTHLGESHNCWRRAVDIVEGDSDVRQFFASVDEECGPINERSPILAISHYVLTSLSRLRKRRDTTGRR